MLKHHFHASWVFEQLACNVFGSIPGVNVRTGFDELFYYFRVLVHGLAVEYSRTLSISCSYVSPVLGKGTHAVKVSLSGRLYERCSLSQVESFRVSSPSDKSFHSSCLAIEACSV